ncbi:alpha/beta hydrolase [Nocardia sp. NBC_01377]|uniref:alpha/beta hydrolase n=1 Tax=Nocardia sp. NBC_01377 TaxID=2903595 RepID=UPI0038638EB7
MSERHDPSTPIADGCAVARRDDHVDMPVRTLDRTLPRRWGGAIPIRDYHPAQSREGSPAVLWLHGGGFVSGNLEQSESHSVALGIASSGRRVRTVDYRLAPRFPWGHSSTANPSLNHYPAGLDDVVDAGRSLAQEGGRIVLGGASAGACLAVTAAQRLPDPAGLLLCYGVYHAELPPLSESVRASVRGLAGYRQLTPPAVHRMSLNYVGDESLLSSGAFPGGGELTGLPPALLLDADHDTLRASGEAFAAELAAAGVPMTYSVVPHTWHGYLNRRHLNGFRYAMAAIRGWLDELDGELVTRPLEPS